MIRFLVRKAARMPSWRRCRKSLFLRCILSRIHPFKGKNDETMLERTELLWFRRLPTRIGEQQ